MTNADCIDCGVEYNFAKWKPRVQSTNIAYEDRSFCARPWGCELLASSVAGTSREMQMPAYGGKGLSMNCINAENLSKISKQIELEVEGSPCMGQRS